ncbi:restriction endonuclease subunit S [Streptomyces sp. NPDC056690]|uniref:restriction endonuclease subunit S n=1 Tax=unclassified Streptomyces TaxID=2593676 RepID=UPI00362FB71A
MTDSGAGDSVAIALNEGLPEGWVRARIGDLCEVNPRAFDEEPDDDDLISQVPMAFVEAESGRMDASTQVRFGDFKKKSLTRFQEDDVLFAKITPCMENGKIAKAQGLVGGRALGSTEFHVLRSAGGVLPEYLMHYLLQRNVRRVAEQHMSGAVGQRRVPRPYLADLEIPVPPLPEQRRIVAKLDEQLAHIEAGEAAVSSAIALRQSLRDALLNLYVLGRNQAPSAESVQEIQAQSSRKIPYGDLVPLPHGWEWRVAREVCPLITSGSTPEASLMSSGFGEIPFLKVYNIKRSGGVDFSIRPTFVDRAVHEGKLKKSRVFPGDVLTNIVGPPLGKTATVPKDHAEWNINQAIVAFRAGPELLPEWLRFVLLSPYVIGLLLKTARATAGQFNIALSTCRELPIPVPPLGVQRQLCEFLSVTLAEFDSLDHSVDEVAEQPSELRGALLHAAFTGTLVPQDPADEPASALLGHIRAQRQAAVKPVRKRTLRKTISKPASSGQEELPL